LGPAPGDESAVPPNNGGGSDDEEHLGEPMTVDGLGQHGEDRSGGLAEPWTAELTLQDQHLMPQSEDLGIASIAGQHEKSDTGHQQADEVGEQTEHGGHRTDDRWAQNQHIRLLGTLTCRSSSSWVFTPVKSALTHPAIRSSR